MQYSFFFSFLNDTYIMLDYNCIYFISSKIFLENILTLKFNNMHSSLKKYFWNWIFAVSVKTPNTIIYSKMFKFKLDYVFLRKYLFLIIFIFCYLLLPHNIFKQMFMHSFSKKSVDYIIKYLMIIKYKYNICQLSFP